MHTIIFAMWPRLHEVCFLPLTERMFFAWQQMRMYHNETKGEPTSVSIYRPQLENEDEAGGVASAAL